MTHQQLVRASYCAGLRIPQDAMRHLTGLGREQTRRVENDITLAMAYTEYKTEGANTFDNGEVDIDTSSSGTDRNLQ